jgi:hypothetical protein
VTEPDPVAALAAQIEEQLKELRGQLARYAGDVGGLRAKLETDSGQVLNLLVQVKQFREELAEAVEKNRLKPPPAPWWGVDREEAGQKLAELREWVDTFLRPHYPGYLARLPRCWSAHAEAVWELSTLRAEWIRIYGDQDNRDLQGALNWHDRYLPGVISRLAASVKCDESGCRMATRRY